MSEELNKAVADVKDVAEEIEALEKFIGDAFPDEWARLTMLKRELPRMGENLKTLVREVGSTTILGLDFKVTPKKMTTVRTFELIDHAKERGDMATLMEYGVVYYDVKAVQIDRLPGDLKAVYSGFVDIVAGTSAVTLPAILK